MFSRLHPAFLMVLSVLLVICVVLSASAESWFCPQCGRIGNTSSTCKGCSAARPAQLLAEMTPADTKNGMANNKDRYSFDENLRRDILGNTFGNVFYTVGTGCGYYCSEKDSYYEYVLNSEYTLLTGTLYLPCTSSGIKSPDQPSVFKVYADGSLIYEAPDFRKGVFDPVELNVNITGCQTLRIVMLGMGNEHNGWQPMICAGDLSVR